MAFELVETSGAAAPLSTFELVQTWGQATNTNAFELVFTAGVAAAASGVFECVFTSGVATAVSSAADQTVEPFDTVTLPAGTWVQTGGPPSITLVSNQFIAPAGPDGYSLQFTSGSTVITIAVYPHTVFLAQPGPVERPLYVHPGSGAVPVVSGSISWKSGAGGPSVAGVSHIANGDFNVWRGGTGPAPIATTWQDAAYSAPSTGLTYLDAGGTYASWSGDMDVTIGGVWSTANGGDATAANNTWANAATGSYDAKWTAILNNVKTHWTRIPRGTIYLRFCHEMNASWYDWQVRSTEVAAFITAWQRFRGLQQSIFPAAKLVFSTITATNRPSDMYDWRTLWPGDAYVDVLGTDYYGDTYKNVVINGGSGFDSSGGPRNLPEYLAFATTHGKPLALSEWGVDPVFGSGDDPNFIQYVYNFVSSNAGTGAGNVSYECYFNQSKSPTDRRQLYYAPGEADANGRTSTEFPLAAARYQSLF